MLIIDYGTTLLCLHIAYVHIDSMQCITMEIQYGHHLAILNRIFNQTPKLVSSHWWMQRGHGPQTSNKIFCFAKKNRFHDKLTYSSGCVNVKRC